ncbi:MAG TPA: bifunctional riboflavin kinase/FMN adenylyltransferase [bacterium]|jgi:riboflavin kinase/FMN adenylyltransferase
MEVYRNFEEWKAPESGCAMVLGRFDGVHLGHRELLERTVAIAKDRGILAACFSFSEITYPGAKHRGILITDAEKENILEDIGIDVLLNPDFKPPIIDTSHGDFVNGFMIGRWHTKVILAGFDFRFGYKRLGDSDFLKEEAGKSGVDVVIIEPVRRGEILIKGSRIRAMICDGEIEHANLFLGRPYSVTTHGESGRGLGNKIGFPTINLPWPDKKVEPRFGVYAVQVGVKKITGDKTEIIPGTISGVANFGIRPTVDEHRTDPILEVHLFDPGEMIDVIGNPPLKDVLLTTEFIGFVRPERKFESVENLKEQIKLDAERAREILRA